MYEKIVFCSLNEKLTQELSSELIVLYVQTNVYKNGQIDKPLESAEERDEEMCRNQTGLSFHHD